MTGRIMLHGISSVAVAVAVALVSTTALAPPGQAVPQPAAPETY
ncbi:hypothetical protein ACWEQ8_30095 [Streptomyces noursei]